jgi:hypothetical protein
MVDDVDWDNSRSVHQSSLRQSYQQSHWEDLGEGKDVFFTKYLFRTCTVLLLAVKSYNIGSPALFSLRREGCADFSIALAGF